MEQKQFFIRNDRQDGPRVIGVLPATICGDAEKASNPWISWSFAVVREGVDGDLGLRRLGELQLDNSAP